MSISNISMAMTPMPPARERAVGTQCQPGRGHPRREWRAGLARATPGMIEVEAPSVEVVDTIGAGDSFQAALLFALARLERIERASLQSIGVDELRRVLSFACQCAAVTCTRAGADPPRFSEVAAFW